MAERDDKRHDGEIAPDAPASAEELAEAEHLRDALAAGARSDDLVGALRAAWAPEPLDEGVHAAMLDDLPTAEEIARANELRAELEAKSPPEIVTVLRSTWSPTQLPDETHRAIVSAALAKAPAAEVVPLRARRVAIAATTVLALAASVVLWMTNAAPREAPLAKARSTQPLFGEPFKAGETSARIDRIALARAADYRDNRFAKWGVR
jgi:hypothetical protein